MDWWNTIHLAVCKGARSWRRGVGVQQGFAIAPVPLNLKRKSTTDLAKVGLAAIW
jgi:hypothetical protein